MGTNTNLCEDKDYLIFTDSPGRLYVDDVDVPASVGGGHPWRPMFYAGHVRVDVVGQDGKSRHYVLGVAPSTEKACQEQFDSMIAAIREFDTTLLVGSSAASINFGRAGRPGRYNFDVLLARIRALGSQFLDAVDAISRNPHRSLAAVAEVVPLTRVRRLHPQALRDRRLAGLARQSASTQPEVELLQVRTATAIQTFDTAANRTLAALLRRFRANVSELITKVQLLKLGAPPEEQAPKVERRLQALRALEARASRLLRSHPSCDVKTSEVTSAGLTQIAAHPGYARAYRLGSLALSMNVEGNSKDDSLHVNQSWGIYEAWCYISVLRNLADALGTELNRATSRCSAPADFAFTMPVQDGELEFLFQAVFPEESVASEALGHSISRQRIPDIVLVLKRGTTRRFVVLDAKWRSGRSNVLDAMQSAHVYHDSLRLDGARPDFCLLLMPGTSSVASLERDEYIAAHHVGAISGFNIDAGGTTRLRDVLSKWLTATPRWHPGSPSAAAG